MSNASTDNTVVTSELDSLPTYVLTHGASGSRVVIARRGATVLSWTAPWKGQLGDFMEGFISEEDFTGQAGMRNGLLFPFANRLRDASYTWDGVTYTVPMQCAGDPETIHGFVRLHDWELVASELDSPEAARLTFAYSIREGEYEWYPFSLDIAVTYELTATSLNVSFAYKNVGTSDAPANFGWHPYYKIPGHDVIDDLALRVPAHTQVETDEALIPLPGDAAYSPLPGELWHETLEDVHYDTAFADLVADGDGIVRTYLTEGDRGAGLSLWQERGTVLVYTEGKFPHYRGSIAIEPVESTTDAFNREDRDAEVRLAPGAERIFRFGATVIGE